MLTQTPKPRLFCVVGVFLMCVNVCSSHQKSEGWAGLHTTGQEVEMHPFIWEASQIPFRWLLQRHHDDHYNRLTLASLTILDFQLGREQSTGNFGGIFLPQ